MSTQSPGSGSGRFPTAAATGSAAGSYATRPRTPSLWDDLPPEPALVLPDPGLSLEERFAQFRDRNPWVEQTLVRLARDLKARGAERVGMKMLFEVLRWQWARTTIDPHSEWSLNNSYTALFSRHLMESYPDLDGLFETRARRTEAA